MDHPTARSTGLISERVGDEVVVLDEVAGIAHCLSPALAAVWDACDGTAAPSMITEYTGLTTVVVDAAIAELCELGLLEEVMDESRPPGDEADEFSRRDVIGRLAKRTAIATSVPLAYSLAVGSPANADSRTCVQFTCSTNSDCNSGLIVILGICRGASRCSAATGRCVY